MMVEELPAIVYLRMFVMAWHDPHLNIHIDDARFEGWKQRPSYISSLLDPFRKLQGLARIEIIWDTNNEPEFYLDLVVGERMDTPVDIMKEFEKHLERGVEAEKRGEWEIIVEGGVTALHTILASRSVPYFLWDEVMDGGVFNGLLTSQ